MVPASESSTVTVQAYLASGSRLCRYVVSGVDPNVPLMDLAALLKCLTYKAVEARYISPGRTCLVRLYLFSVLQLSLQTL